MRYDGNILPSAGRNESPSSVKTRICLCSIPLVSSRLAFFDNACFVCSAQSKIGGLRKNEAPLQRPAIQDNQHVFLYILPVFGYVT